MGGILIISSWFETDECLHSKQPLLDLILRESVGSVYYLMITPERVINNN